MKPYFIEVNDNGKRAGPITEHTNNFVLRAFETLPDAHTVTVFSSLTATEPRARYVRDGDEVQWFAPIKSRKTPAQRTTVDKVTGKRRRRSVNAKVRRSREAGKWVHVGTVVHVQPEVDDVRPTTVSTDDFLLDLVENPYVL